MSGTCKLPERAQHSLGHTSSFQQLTGRSPNGFTRVSSLWQPADTLVPFNTFYPQPDEARELVNGQWVPVPMGPAAVPWMMASSRAAKRQAEQHPARLGQLLG
jgi:hypothetical protein